MACGGDDASEIDHVSSTERDATAASKPARYVGEVEDSDVRVGVVADGEHARVFFCGGDDSFATATRWFNLEVHDSELNVDDGEWHLHATHSDERVDGEITHDPDAARPFSTTPIAEDTLSGLYEGTAPCGRMGLIVSQARKGAAIDAQGACVGDGHTPEQVNPIMPLAAESGKIRVQTPTEDATALLQAATLTPL
jgi:hypothetical protein